MNKYSSKKKKYTTTVCNTHTSKIFHDSTYSHNNLNVHKNKENNRNAENDQPSGIASNLGLNNNSMMWVEPQTIVILVAQSLLWRQWRQNQQDTLKVVFRFKVFTRVSVDFDITIVIAINDYSTETTTAVGSVYIIELSYAFGFEAHPLENAFRNVMWNRICCIFDVFVHFYVTV